MWQALREELHPRGLEVVTVALDTGGVEAVRRWVEAAEPAHPSLIDEAHLLDEVLGIVNVPMAVWIDEEGTLVRPPEVATLRRFDPEKLGVRPEDLPPKAQAMLAEVKRIRTPEPERYMDALRDWVQRGPESRFALAPEEVVERSRPRPAEVARAAAAFELGQHLWRSGSADDAVPWFREAHRLQPENWTYKRQAWSFVDPIFQDPGDVYEGSWLDDVRAVGAENYYLPAPDFSG